MWQFYLAGVVVTFRYGGIVNYQVQYIRDRHALPITRDYMAEAEQRFRQMEKGRTVPDPALRTAAEWRLPPARLTGRAAFVTRYRALPVAVDPAQALDAHSPHPGHP